VSPGFYSVSPPDDSGGAWIPTKRKRSFDALQDPIITTARRRQRVRVDIGDA
jgi:hypothetical protein